MVLDTITDDTFRTTAEAKNIRAGGLWGELQQGTNALGLASAMKAPVTVHGPEHFFRMHDGLTCNAAPIFGPSGEIAGVLDASSDCRSRQRHTMALVKMSVRQIENGLFRDLHRNNLVLIFHTRAEYLRTLSAGLLAVDPSGTILAASAQAAFFLQGLPARPGHHFAELFRTGFLEFLDESHRRDRVRLEDHEGSSYVVMIDNLHQACPLHRHAEPKPKPKQHPSPDFIAEDPAVVALLGQVAGAVARGVPILIRGPTGTGKELMARHAHAVSGRTGAFVPVNCAALPDTLIEAELFGYAEGAFTGARRGGAKGLVDEADGGTLFLDEIGDMPVQLQSILLRLLDDWTIRPVGGTRPAHCRCPTRRRHQREPGGSGPRRTLPRRPAVPAEHDRGGPAAAGGAHGFQPHRKAPAAHDRPGRRNHRCGADTAGGTPLARQCPGTAQRADPSGDYR